MHTYDPDDINWTASSWLGEYANSMQDEFRDCWELQNVPADSELTEAERQEFTRLDELGGALIGSLRSLAIDADVVNKVNALFNQLGGKDEASFAVKVARSIHFHPIIKHGIGFRLADEAIGSLLHGAEKRMVDLLGLVAERRLSERAAAYLDRATRLYLWGFDPEAVIMAAAVLEAAYAERFSDADMMALQIRKQDKEFRASDFEHAALASGVYTKAERDIARNLRLVRNDTLHNVPVPEITSLDALGKCALLLGKLLPA